MTGFRGIYCDRLRRRRHIFVTTTPANRCTQVAEPAASRQRPARPPARSNEPNRPVRNRPAPNHPRQFSRFPARPGLL